MTEDRCKTEPPPDLMTSFPKKNAVLDKLLGRFEIDENTEKSAHRLLGALDCEKALGRYGEAGVERYVGSLLGITATQGYRSMLLDEIVSKESVSRLSKSGRVLGKILTSPGKFFSAAYDFTLRKTGSHIAADISMAFAGTETMYGGWFVYETTYFSSLYHIPFWQLFIEELPMNLPSMVGYGVITGALVVGLRSVLIAATRKKFSPDILNVREVEKDIRKYVKDFNAIYSQYRSSFLNKVDTGGVSLRELNAIYMMSSTKASVYMMNGMNSIKEYEKSVLPYEEAVLHKKLKQKSIIHRSPRGVGGATMLFSSLIGKGQKKGVHGYVFVNSTRACAAPEYIFGVYHELAHHAGAASEPMASYYAMLAMEKLAEDHPLEGYDLYTSVNKLLSAVGTMRRKYDTADEYRKELRRLRLPRFVYESFDVDFNPPDSIAPPMREAASDSVDAVFADLYVSGPYIAFKEVERGHMKVFGDAPSSAA